MNIDVATLNPHTMQAPRSAQDVIALLELACACVDRMNDCMRTRIQLHSMNQAA